MWIDSHCHLSDPRVSGQLEEIIESCRKEKLTGFMLGGVCPKDWDRQQALSNAYPGVFFKVFGLHPWWVDEHCQDKALLQEGLNQLRSRHSSAVALGEAGLDGARGRMKRSHAEQLWVFREQLALARETGKPMVLHVVRAHSEALSVLEDKRNSGLSGIVHSFSGDQRDAKRYLEMGWLLSISARLTYPDSLELRRIVKKCPPDQLVFETDAPDQPPFGHEQAVHTPVSLFKVVEMAALLRVESEEVLLKRSRENLIRAFGLGV